MFNVLIKIFEHGEKSGIIPALLLIGMLSLFVLAWVFYKLIYQKDQIDLNKLLTVHIADEEKKFDNLAVAIDKLTVSINNINVTLIKENIAKANVDKKDFNLVDIRLNETADVTFNGAYQKACVNCDGLSCKYYEEFSNLIQSRRKESWHIWEQASVSRGLLSIVEQCNNENYPKIIINAIPEITSLCVNPDTKDLPKDFKLKLIKAKVDMLIERTKKEWGRFIERRINIEN